MDDARGKLCCQGGGAAERRDKTASSWSVKNSVKSSGSEGGATTSKSRRIARWDHDQDHDVGQNSEGRRESKLAGSSKSKRSSKVWVDDGNEDEDTAGGDADCATPSTAATSTGKSARLTAQEREDLEAMNKVAAQAEMLERAAGNSSVSYKIQMQAASGPGATDLLLSAWRQLREEWEQMDSEKR